MTIVDFLIARNIPFRKHSTKNDEFWVCCPLCGDARFRLGVNIRKNIANCFNGSCNFKSKKASVALAYHFNVAEFKQVGVFQLEPEVEIPVTLPEDFTRLTSKANDYLVRKARRYAAKRGVDIPTARRWGVGVSLSGRYAYRIVIPVRRNDKLVGLVARDFTGNQTPKYLMNTGEKYLWGCRPTPEIILAEGVFKAMALEKAFQMPAAALLGRTITDKMLMQLLEDGVSRAILWPDPDRPGVEGVIRIAKDLLEIGVSSYVPILLPERPADDATQEELRAHGQFGNAIRHTGSYMRQVAKR